MKKTILFIIAIALFNCSAPKDKKAEQIEADIVANAMETDIGYTPVSTKEAAVLTLNDYYNVSKVMLNVEDSPEELSERLQFIVDKAKGENDGNTYHMWKFNLDNLKKYQDAPDKSSSDVKFIEHNYTIINPLFDDAKVDITNFYVFDMQDNLLGRVSQDDMKQFKKEYVLHEKLPYLVAYYEAIQ